MENRLKQSEKQEFWRKKEKILLGVGERNLGGSENRQCRITDEKPDRWISWIFHIQGERGWETEKCWAHPTGDPRNMAAGLVQHFPLSQGVWNEKWNAGRTCCHSHSYQKYVSNPIAGPCSQCLEYDYTAAGPPEHTETNVFSPHLTGQSWWFRVIQHNDWPIWFTCFKQ